MHKKTSLQRTRHRSHTYSNTLQCYCDAFEGMVECPKLLQRTSPCARESLHNRWQEERGRFLNRFPHCLQRAVRQMSTDRPKHSRSYTGPRLPGVACDIALKGEKVGVKGTYCAAPSTKNSLRYPKIGAQKTVK